jgi:predicted transcriptional regulator
MSTLIQLTAQIVSAHVSNIQMSSDEMLQELQKVHASLKALEGGSPLANQSPASTVAPKLSIKQAFKKDEVICMVCGKGGFKTLKKHLSMAHGLKPGEYRKQFGIPSTQSLAAKSYSDSRRQMAIDKGLGEGLAKARAVRSALKIAVPVVKTKAPEPDVKEKAPEPAVKA